MKILYCLNDYSSGGAEKGLIHLIKSGFFEGHELTVVSLFGGSGQLKKEMEGLSISGGIHQLMQQKAMKYSLMPVCLLKLINFIKELKPEICIFSLPQANILGRIAAKLSAPKSIIASFEHSTKYDKGIYGYLLKLTSSLVDAVLYDSKETVIAVKKWFRNRDRLYLEVPLVSISEQKIEKDYNLHSPVKIITTGRLVETKKQEIAIRAIKILKSENIEAELNIIGEGEKKADLINIISELGLERNIKFLGYVENWIDNCRENDIYVHPSEHEGLCISVLEAMGCGMPIICRDVGGMKTYGNNAVNMVKVSEMNENILAQKIKELIEDDVLREKIGKNAKADSVKLYGEESVKTKLKDQMNELVGIYGK